MSFNNINREEIQEALEEGFRFIHGFKNPDGIDYTKAIKKFEEASLLGSPAAKVFLGYCTEKGIGIEENSEKADVLFTESLRENIVGLADQGDGYCQLGIGFMYQCGIKVVHNEKLAIEYYKKSIENNIIPAYFAIGQTLLIEPNTTHSAIEYFSKGIEYGCSLCQYQLGLLSVMGEYMNQDALRGFRWILAAADQNDCRAQYLIAHWSFRGTLSAKDLAISLTRYQKAAKQNHVGAQHELGVKLVYGEGFSRDYEEGLKWLQISAKRSYVRSQYELAKVYFSGETDIPKDDKEALKWLYYCVLEE